MNTKKVGTLTHDEASRKNIPTAEYDALLTKDDRKPIEVAYERCNQDLDPQLVWRGKDPRDWAELVVQAPPLFIQEKIHPKVLIDDLAKMQKSDSNEYNQPDLFADFNGLPDEHTRTEFYSHDSNWTNRMILGDSLQVMASLAEREGLGGKVQCIFIDPPYGIKFNSNFQWQTNDKTVKDGDIPREPEQVKAYRDTWKDGVHSYLTYLRDRLTVARDLLSESGSIFVQIGEQNVHRVRVVMDEVFGESNFVNQINFRSNSGTERKNSVKRTVDYLLWYAKEKESMKFRRFILDKDVNTENYNQLLFDDLSVYSMNLEQKKDPNLIPSNAKIFRTLPIHSMRSGDNQPREAFGKYWSIPNNCHWRFKLPGFERLLKAGRIQIAKNVLCSRYFHTDYAASELTDIWNDTGPEIEKSYIVQTSKRPIERCVLMVTDPGDIVLDPTCGSGTVAVVAEQWGRRWITIDTSRVALALARARLMGAKFDWYLLSDSSEGQKKEAEISNRLPSSAPTRSDIRQGFVYHRVPHITLNSIAENAEIDIIWKKYQEELEPLREKLNQVLKESWNEWDIPHEVSSEWPDEAKEIHAEWWKNRIFRQKEVDASIEANTEFKLRYDKPYIDKSWVRVAGPFTVESISPHRVMAFDENDELFDSRGDDGALIRENQDFVSMIINHLSTSGAQQVHKEDKIDFMSLTPWPGKLICAEGIPRVTNDSGKESRVAIFVGPEFGTVSRPDLVEAAREAADAGFDMLVACAFNYDVQAGEFDQIGKVPVLKARMHPDLHMAGDLSSASQGNLFVIFGEPDIEIISTEDDLFQVKINGVDVFHPRSGELRSHGPEGIACWFLDSDYNGESFFVRHAYFLGTPDPYKALKKTLNTEIDKDAWDTLKSNVSRPFTKPTSGRIAVKVINNLGDEVMKVFKVS